MTIIGAMIFCVCCWAIFSKRFCDGIVAKHLFTLSAITAALVVLDPVNGDALVCSLLCMVAGFAYWAIKHHRQIRHHLVRH